MRRFIVCLALMLSFASTLLAQPAGGGQYSPKLPLDGFLAYGPRKFERLTGQSTTYTETFTIPKNLVGPFTLYVANGWPSGIRENDCKNPVTSATIKINGTTVIDQDDFKEKKHVIIRSVTLSEKNTIQVTLKGKPGSFISLVIVGTDKTPPKLVITSPTQNLITKESRITCSGTVSDETRVTLTIDGEVVFRGRSGAFSEKIQLKEGINTITFVAKDLFGNETKEMRQVQLDTKPPQLTVTSPADGYKTSSSTVTVSGKMVDATPVTVTVNDQNVPVSSAGTFTDQVPINVGQNTITIVVTDAAGNTTTQTRTVTRTGSNAPTLVVTQPIDGFATKENTVTVQGTAVDSSGTTLTVTVNGSSVAIGTGGAFSTQATLTEGTNTITIVATNGSGQSTAVTRTVKKDSTPPLLSVTNPTDGQLTRDSSVVVLGTVTDASVVTLTVNGQQTIIDPSGTFSAIVSLNEGTNQVNVTAIDALGNTSTITRTIIKDTTPPTILITSNITLTRDSLTTITGKVSDVTSVQVIVDGQPVTVQSDGSTSLATSGSFSRTIALVEGTNQIYVEATDALGNQSTQTVTIIRDSQPPVITLSSSNDNKITKDSVVSVKGTVSDSSSMTITVNGKDVTINGGTFETTVTLIEGVNTITIVATDAVGNSSTITRKVIRDTQAPALAITNPADGFITKDTSVTVKGITSDLNGVSLTINGQLLNVGIDSTFTTQVSLKEGINTITVTAADSAGNTTTLNRMVRRKTTIPVLTITSPKDSLITRDSIVIFTGTVNDSTVQKIYLNADSTMVASDVSWSKQVLLNEGRNGFTITATDIAGNQTTKSRLIIKDTQPPLLIVNSPIEGFTTNRKTASVNGTVNDSTNVALTINKSNISIGAGGAFSTTVNLPDAVDTLIVYASDAAGNISQLTRIIKVDTSPPVLVITSPKDSLFTNDSTVIVKGSVADSSGIKMTINSTAATVDSAGNFSQPIKLTVGQNTLTITATDDAGNVTTLSREVTCDPHAVIISFEQLVDSLKSVTGGTANPFNVIDTIASMQRGSMDAVKQLLSMDFQNAQGDTSSTIDSSNVQDTQRQALLGVSILEVMSTPPAFSLLMQTAELHNDSIVRGNALNALASTYYEVVTRDSLAPDSNVVRIFLKYVDNGSEVKGLWKSYAQIAREGLISWTGIDPGDSIIDETDLTDPDTGLPATAAQLREKWWSDVGSKMKWDITSMQFKIQ